MDQIQKSELKKEITDEVKTDLTRFAGNHIKIRILLALAIISLEVAQWTMITASVVRDASVGQGIATGLLVFGLRLLQANLIIWFNEK